MSTDQWKQFVLFNKIRLHDTNILAIELVVAIEVAASSHTLFCCRSRTDSGLSGDRFKPSQTHPRTNEQLTTQPFFISFMWNEEDVALFNYQTL